MALTVVAPAETETPEPPASKSGKTKNAHAATDVTTKPRTRLDVMRDMDTWEAKLTAGRKVVTEAEKKLAELKDETLKLLKDVGKEKPEKPAGAEGKTE
jgi:hypothetical protein